MLGVEVAANWSLDFALLWVPLCALVNFTLAVAVTADISARRQRSEVVMFGRQGTWGLFTLVLGVVGLAAYWVIHYSTLSRLKSRGHGSPQDATGPS